jgi:hypothetical protein
LKTEGEKNEVADELKKIDELCEKNKGVPEIANLPNFEKVREKIKKDIENCESQKVSFSGKQSLPIFSNLGLFSNPECNPENIKETANLVSNFNKDVDLVANKNKEIEKLLVEKNPNDFLRFSVDDDIEPIKPQAGTIGGFVEFLNNTRTKMGALSGLEAHDAMIRLGKTEITLSKPIPMPATTAPFNNIKNRYIYTGKGGWIDMAHFMFYAGRAYKYKMQKEELEMVAKNPTTHPTQQAKAKARAKNINPVGDAVQDGYNQELSDIVVAPHSAYSYEDLPSDKFGAEFGANYFDSKSNLTLGEQLKSYMNTLGATSPDNAPNFKTLPTSNPKETPTEKNKSTKPLYVK